MANMQTPPLPRKWKDKGEKMMIMKCQTLTADKTYEEIEIEVPVLIFNRISRHSGKEGNRKVTKEDNTFSKRIKNIFVKEL